MQHEHSMTRVNSLFTTVLCCVLLWAAPLGAQPPQRIVVVGDSSYAPFEYLDSSGRAVGIFVDYWRIWSQAVGVEVDYRLMDWSDALQAVLSGQADMVGGIFHSPEREAQFDFSPPYFSITTHIFAHRDVVVPETLADLRNRRVGVVQDDLAMEYLLRELPEVELRPYPSHEALARAAQQREIRIFVADTAVMTHHLVQLGAQGEFRQSAAPLYVSRVHAAVKKGNAAALNLVRQGMARIPERQMDLLIQEWMHHQVHRVLPWQLAAWSLGGGTLAFLLVLLWNRLMQRRVARAVEAFRRSERKFRAVFDNSFQFAALLDREGRVIELNQTTLDRLPPHEETLQGQLFWEIPGWRDNPHAVPQLQHALLHASAGDVMRFEVEVEDPKGSMFLDVSCKPLHNDQGLVDMLLVEARDLSLRKEVERELQSFRDNLQRLVDERTRELSEANAALQRENDERGKAEAALRASEEKYRLLVENAGEGIVVLQGSKLRFCNPKVEAIAGFTAAELLERPFIELIHPEDRAMVATNYQLRMSGEAVPEKYAFRVIDRYGVVRWLEITAVVFAWEGAPATLNLLTDVTERKEAERAMQEARKMAEDASRIMSDFVSMVSHELRTPMTSVLGFAKLISKDFRRWFLGAPQQKPEQLKRGQRIEQNLDIIIAESERLTLLISDVLDLARLEARQYDWLMLPNSMQAMAEQVVAATSPLFMDRPVRCEARVDPDLPEVPCDRKSIVQVLVNLVANAAKFTDQGSVTVSARRQGAQILVSVCDTGIGIPPEEQEIIFERFRQSGETLTDKPRGTGLGLTICREIVEQHGGRIWVESTPGQGSCFFFTLPIDLDLAEEAINRG